MAPAGQRLPLQQELEVGALPQDEAEQCGPRHAQRKHTLQRGFAQGGCQQLYFITLFLIMLQGGHSGCVKPPVDIKTKVPF